MPLQETSGNVTVDAYGGGVAVVPVYIEDVMSVFLYTGNNSTQTITNGIDLSTYGGLVWTKCRGEVYYHYLFDTARGVTKGLASNDFSAQTTDANGVTAFGTTGYSLGNLANVNGLNLSGFSTTYASWTFRKQPKFFDVVTWTGDGNTPRNIAHNLGSVPGCIIVKCTSNAYNWTVYHTSLGGTKYMILNGTNAASTASGPWANTNPTSTQFTVGSSFVTNGAGETYVAYLFAHNAGGFGLTGTDNVISCGSFSAASGGSVSLGYEPQWVMFKQSDGASDWYMVDNMRGFANGTSTNQRKLLANTSAAESNVTGVSPTATGFDYSAFGGNWIYIAIRRGPMKTPTSGTSVFYPQTIAQANTIDSTGVPFPPDLVNTFSRNGTDRTSTYNLFQFVDRLRGLGTPSDTWSSASAASAALISSSTNAESSGTGAVFVQLKADGQNITRSTGWGDAVYGNWIYYFMRRAPGFFDVVCYTGNGTSQTITHNLGVQPELWIVKDRANVRNWQVGSTLIPNTYYLVLNTTAASADGSTQSRWNDTYPTASVFSVGNTAGTNASGATYVAYLFASCPGVSKVGSYTGNGSTQTINCGFTGGARFVLIKRVDATGDWYVYDTARGMTTLTDPYLLLNSTAAESATLGSVTTVSTGFALNASILAAINTNGASYIFLAIA